MELTKDEFIKYYGKHCGHCNRKTLLPYEYEWTCISCGYYVIKREQELSKNQREKINFINQLKQAEQEIFCICIEVYQLYESNDYDKIYEVLSTLKKLKISKTLIEK